MSGDSDLLILQGLAALQTGQHATAAGLLAAALRTRSTPVAYRALGDALRAMQRYTEALASYTAAAHADPLLADAHLGRAASLVELGRPAEALPVARRVLCLRPGDAEAHNYCGLALRGLGRQAEALTEFDRALALQPRYVAALNNRAITLQDLDRAAEAVATLDHAIALQGGIAELHNNRGNALRDLRAFEAALASYERAIALRPAYAVAHINRGAVLGELERFEEALASHDRALVLLPGLALAWVNRAVALQGLGRLEESLASCGRAIELAPDLGPAHNNRGRALQALGRREEALAAYRRAVELDPRMAEAHLNLATALRDAGHPQEALASLATARALRPGLDGLDVNAGNALRDLQRSDEALEHYDRALLGEPVCATLHCNRGAALADLDRPREALTSFDRAIELDPGHADAYFNKSRSLLRAGEFTEGFRLHEWRTRLPALAVTRRMPGRLWLGEEDIAGRVLLLHAEQGLGDTIQFSRYARLARARGAHVILAVQPPLRRLLATLGPSIEVVSLDTLPVHHDLHTPLLSLPLAFGTRLDTIPAEVPYLEAEARRIEEWRLRLGGGGFRVGICWQGSPNAIDIGRSIPLACFRPLASIPGVRLISLQKGHGVDQLGTRPDDLRVEELGDGFDRGDDAFLDTAAVMRSLDLVITSDTSIAHLAGALGCATWIALQRVPDWRWLQDRADSPWYPTVRLYRQPRQGDWPAVFAAIRTDLARTAAAHPPADDPADAPG